MTSIEIACEYIGQLKVGFTVPGQCVAFWNLVNRRFLQLDYPIRNAMGAVDILGVPSLYSNTQKDSGLKVVNTRPDLVEQVVGLSKRPSIGDWIIWNKSWGGGLGHLSCLESFTPDGFIGIEQNFVANKVTRENHNWTNVAGYIHYKQGNDMQPITPNELTDMIGMMQGRVATAEDHTNWDGKPFYDTYMAWYKDGRTFEYADKCYKAINDPTNCSKAERAYLDSGYEIFNKKGK